MWPTILSELVGRKEEFRETGPLSFADGWMTSASYVFRGAPKNKNRPALSKFLCVIQYKFRYMELVGILFFSGYRVWPKMKGEGVSSLTKWKSQSSFDSTCQPVITRLASLYFGCSTISNSSAKNKKEKNRKCHQTWCRFSSLSVSQMTFWICIFYISIRRLVGFSRFLSRPRIGTYLSMWRDTDTRSSWLDPLIY